MTSSELIEAIHAAIADPYDSDGNPKYFLVSAEDDVLSVPAAQAHLAEIIDSTSRNTGDCWCVTAVQVNRDDPGLKCDETGETISRRST